MNHEILRTIAVARPMSLQELALEGWGSIPSVCEAPAFDAAMTVLREKADEATAVELERLTERVWVAYTGAMNTENGPSTSETCQCWEDCNCGEQDDVSFADQGSEWFDGALDVLGAAFRANLDRLGDQARNDAEDEAEARAWDALHRRAV